MRSVVFFLFIFVACVYAKKDGFLPVLEEKLENTFTEYAGYFTNWLQGFNDDHLGKSQMGRFLHYDEMKTKIMETENQSEGRSMKKMGMAMIPLIFHIGATSTWMLLTTILTAKSLAVGLALLVVKIAVSSAKLGSFFTHLKHSKHEHHDWAPPAWLPHFDHHDHHDHHIEHHPEHHGTISHHPEWTPNDIPHHFHEYKNNEFHDLKNNEFHDFKNNEFHDLHFKPHEFNDYKTIPTHDLHGLNDGFHGDFNYIDGAKKKIDTKVG